MKNSDEQQEKKFGLASLRQAAATARQHLGAIIGVITALVVVAVASFSVGTHFGSVPKSTPIHADAGWPTKNYETVPACDLPPAPVETPDPGASTTRPPTATPPSEPCVPPSPDVIVLLSPTKAKALPVNTGACVTANGYGAMYTCGPRSYKDVEAFAAKVLTPEQLAFVNDHVLASQDALWAFDVRDTAALKGQSTSPGATYDESSETITVYAW